MFLVKLLYRSNTTSIVGVYMYVYIYVCVYMYICMYV